MSNLMIVALTMTIGYLLGRVKVKGLSSERPAFCWRRWYWGISALSSARILKKHRLGMLCHCGGHHRRSNLLRELQKERRSTSFLGFLTIGIGAAVCVAVIRISGLPHAAGPGASQRRVNEYARPCGGIGATGDPIASVGYGIAYPFGVLGVVLFVQVFAHTAENGC